MPSIVDTPFSIAPVEFAVYSCVLIIIIIVFHTNSSISEGCVFLLTFCMIRITGAYITYASELETDFFATIAVLQGIGLAFLLLTTMYFVGDIEKNSKYSDPRLKRIGNLLKNRFFRTWTILIVLLGFNTTILGGLLQAPGGDAYTIATGRSLTKAGMIFLGVEYVGVLVLHVAQRACLRAEKGSVPPEYQKLLHRISLALPPLFVRIVYALLGAFATSLQSRWSPVAGFWAIYLAMGFFMEFMVMSVYIYKVL